MVVSHLMLTRLIAADGFRKTREFVAWQSALRLSQADIATPSTDSSDTLLFLSQSLRDFFVNDNEACQYLKSQHTSQDQNKDVNTLNFTNTDAADADADVDDVVGIFK
jgi:hypothetical protein